MTPTATWVRWGGPPCAGALVLLCLPWVGAGAAPFRAWAAELNDVELWAARLPARELRVAEAPIDDLDELVALLVRETELVADRPFAIFGHCLGALLAFELTRELRRRNSALPVRLLLAGQPAPVLGPPIAWDGRSDLRTRLGVAELTNEEVLANDELYELLRPALEADVRAAAGYVYSGDEPLPVPITVFYARNDGHMDRGSLERWRQETSAGLEIRELAGNHLFAGGDWLHLARAVRGALVERG